MNRLSPDSRARRALPVTPLIAAVAFASTLAVPTFAQADHPVAAPDVAAASAPLRIAVSLRETRLWLIQGNDTLLSAPVAIGRRESFVYDGRRFDWQTPVGTRTVLDKRADPVWTVPQWHYYERASSERLQVVEIQRGRKYPLQDGSRLEVIGDNVARVRDNSYWKVPQDRELIIDGVLYVPPPGTRQRRVRGALGTRALDLGDGYLIHGTHAGNRSSIGSAASHGCVRMRNEDVERLFELVGIGTTVEIF